MNKWLLLLGVLALAFWWVSRGRAGRRGRSDEDVGRHPGGGEGRGDVGASPARPNAVPRPEPMVVCAHCGVHLPRAEAVWGGAQDQAYCGPAHREAGPRKPA